jgi:hypothetical protein
MMKTRKTSMLNIQVAFADLADRIVEGMEPTTAEKIGLDPRAGYRLFISEECIAVPKTNDGSLQYYGGFEYVEKECRSDVGDYVFYFIGDSRIEECIETFYNKTDSEE